MTSPATPAAIAMCQLAKSIRRKRVMCPSAAKSAQPQKVERVGLLMLAKPMQAIAAKIPSLTIS